MKLRWEKQGRNSWYAYSGRLVIGMVTERFDGRVGYQITAVQMKWIGKGSGDVASMSAGKRAIERAWDQWLKKSGLAPCPSFELVRTESEQPVPSHGGDAVGVTWTLSVNGTPLLSEYDRYRWDTKPARRALLGAQPPSSLKAIHDKLVNSFN